MDQIEELLLLVFDQKVENSFFSKQEED